MKNAFAVIASVLFSMPAFATDAAAGQHSPDVPVMLGLSTPDGVARGAGSIYWARHSSDTSSDIGCVTLAAGVLCNMLDPNGNEFACYTSDPAYLPVIAAVNPLSWITFSTDSDGQCTNVTVTNSSDEMH